MLRPYSHVLWAFVLVFVNDVKSGRVESQMYYYVVAIALANLIQACVVLPLFMNLILPFYLILDMFETAINVWSDACVTLAVSKDIESSGLET